MSSRNYETQILDSIQMIVDNAISKASFDKTVKAVISSVSNEAEGKYTVTYQGNTMIVYSSNPDTRYTEGTEVYILIPGNDANQKKTIIGSVENLGLDYATAAEGDAGYEIIGSNVINSDKTFELCSYKSEEVKILYHRDENINLINFDTQGFEAYAKNGNYLICGAYFQTSLPQEQQVQGEYGIAFEIDYQSGEDIITKTYIVNTDKMVGTPYALIDKTRQYSIFKIDNTNISSVKQIYLFEYNFPNEKENQANDIFVSQIEMKAANALSSEALSSTILTLNTLKGVYFNASHKDEDALPIEAQVRVKGRAIGDTSNIKYYWFRENNRVTSSHHLYNRLGGQGWECLNDSNPYQNVGQNVEWVPGSSLFNTTKKDNVARETKYKCVAVYNKNTILQKDFIITNYDSQYIINIFSEEGTTFYYDNGKPTLICQVNGEEELSEDYVYVWSSLDNNNKFTSLVETTTYNDEYNTVFAAREQLLADIAAESVLTGKSQAQLNQYNETLERYENLTRIEKNKIYNINLKEITYFTTYKCSVFRNDVFIGTTSIVITNDITSNISYSLAINNGNQIFKYNEAGIAPNSDSVLNPIEVLPLSFTLYDKDGKEVNQALIEPKNIFWTVPMQHTLIEEPNNYDEYESTFDYITYNGTRDLSFDICPTFYATHENNNIQLKVKYKGYTITATTDFTFIKTGETGTNGTDYVCKLVPNLVSQSEKVSYPIVTYYEDTGTYSLNYRTPEDGKWFKAQLWKNGELIFNGTESGYSEEGQQIFLQWNILQNKYGDNKKDDSNFEINILTGAITFNQIEYEHPANIIKCQITYNNLELFALMPVTVVRVANANYQIEPVANTGFQEVMYTADGKSPVYNSTRPFELEVYEYIENEWENVSILEHEYSVNYDWNVKGQVYYSYWQSESNLIEKTLYVSRESRNQKYFEPVDIYNGLCVNNAIKCKITRGDTVIGSVHMPVHFYLNRYGNAAINGWDGNSISIDENNSGMILAPQVGAGTKNEDNSFTGIFMGSVKEAGAIKEEHGLFGYNAGRRTIALNAEDGSARFGTSGRGQIVIDPSTGRALIESGNFNPDAGTGMRIDLSEPSIEFGSGNFKVDKYGRLTAAGFSTTEYVDKKKDEIIQEVEGMLDQSPLKIQLSTENIFIPCNDENVPIYEATYNVDFTGTFNEEELALGLIDVIYSGKGFPQTVNNITITLDDTEQQLHFSVKNYGVVEDVAIPTNSSLTFDFIYLDEVEDVTYTINKTVTITVLPPGAPGKSAYDIWLDQGNVGTEDDYLASLKGEDGVLLPLDTEKGFNSKDLSQSIQLFDSGENTLPYLKIYGNTIQNSILGNNLCPDLSTSDKNGIWKQGSYDYTTIEPLSDGWVRFSYDNSANTSSRTCSANLEGYRTGWEINQTYLFVVETRNVNNPGNISFYPHVVTTSNTSYNIFTTGFGSISATDLKSKNIFMKELPTNTKKTWDYAKCMSQFTVPAGQTFSIEVRYSWLKEYEGIDETNFVYEKYQCISPSLDNPSKINSLGYTNEFDEEAWAQKLGITPSEYTEDGYPLYSLTYNTAAKAGRILEGYFKENTSYYFSMIGREDAFIWGSNPHTWGFKFVYTDGTEKILYVPDGNYNTGEIEKAYTTTDPNKTIAYIIAHNWGDFATTKTTVGKIFLRESAADQISYIPHGQYAIDIKSFGKNLINLDTLIPDTYINGKTGEETPYTGYVCSPFIEITSFKTLYVSNNGRGMISFYDKDKKYLGTSINGTLRTDGDRWSTSYYWAATVQVPFDQYPTVKYFRVSYYDKTTEATSLKDLKASERYYTKFGVTSELTLSGGNVSNSLSKYTQYSTIRLKEQLKAHKYNQTRDEMTIENGLSQIINKTRFKTFTGEEDWTIYQETDNYIAFGWDTQNESFSFDENTMVCSHFQFMKEWDYEVSFVEEENFWYDYDYANGTEFIGFKILKTRLEELTLESFKNWLSKQEITFTVVNNETYLSEDTCVIPTYKNNTILKISSLEIPANEVSGTYYTVYKGNQGDSMICKIIASSQFFKSTDGPGGLFSPAEIYLFPELYGVSFNRWEYSIDSVNWEIAVSGEHGIEIKPYSGKENVLILASDSDLYTREDTTLSFRCITNYPTVYDSITIAKMYDVTDLSVGGRNFFLKSHMFETAEIGGGPLNDGETANWIVTEPEAGISTTEVYIDEGRNQWWKIKSNGNTSGQLYWTHSNLISTYLQDLDQYVFSCEIYAEPLTSGLIPQAPLIQCQASTGYGVLEGSVGTKDNPLRMTYTNVWHKYKRDADGKIVYQTDSNGDLVYDNNNNPIPVENAVTDFRFDFGGLTGVYYITKLKIEKGKNATDWTLAPEDTEMTAEIEYCIGSSPETPPDENDQNWGSLTQYEADLAKGTYLWSRVKNTSTSGIVVYTKYSCLITFQKELQGQSTEYALTDISDEHELLAEIEANPAAFDWSTIKPTEPIMVSGVVTKSKLWSRTCLDYKSIVNGKEYYYKDYANYTLDTAWEKMLAIENQLDAKIADIIKNTREGFVRIEDGNIIIANDVETPSHFIIMNHYGIAFLNKEDNPGWPTEKEIETVSKEATAWTIDGSLDMNYINVDELEATYIKNENLILGNHDNRLVNDLDTVDAGDLDIYDKNGNLIFETITGHLNGLPDHAIWIHGFKIHQYTVEKLNVTDENEYAGSTWVHKGYIKLSSEHGFGEYDVGNKIIYGNKSGVWFSRVSETNKQIVSAIDDSGQTYGIQMIPMIIKENGTIVNKGLAFLRMDAEN